MTTTFRAGLQNAEVVDSTRRPERKTLKMSLYIGTGLERTIGTSPRIPAGRLMLR
jgi:hypothetical protein